MSFEHFPFDEEDDPLGAARTIITAVLWGLVMWLAVSILTVYLLIRYEF
jgi:hypothetical protein